jgi:threonine dehydrogenase-like Zn-dependent dehydrogenase
MPTSRAAVYDGEKPHFIEVRDFKVDELGPAGELVLRTWYCGVCGSDLHRWSWSKERPVILGHEILGIVERAPAGWLAADGTPLSIGDLVMPETRIPCHRCEYCRGVGSRPSKLIDYSHCPNQRGLGGIPLEKMPLLSGGWSDYVELPQGTIVHHIGRALDPAVAVLLEPFSIGMKASRVADVNRDDTVVVLGPGPIGLLTVVAAREAGARRIILAGRAGDEARLELGRQLGADETLDVGAGDPIERLRALNGGRLATRVIEATGAAGAIELGVDMLARGGVLVTVGGHRPDVRASVNPSVLVNLQLEIRGTQLGGNNYEACLSVLSRGKYPFSRLVTHRFPLPEIQVALETFERRGPCIKPVIVFDR